MIEKLRGMGVALVTPFKKDQTLDLVSLEKLLVFTSQHGANYWVVHGTTGEAATTTINEKLVVFDILQANNPQKIPIVYGISGNHTADCLTTLRHLPPYGITALLVTSPYYNKPAQEGIYKHYQLLADASPYPILLYNIPARTGSTILPTTVQKLSQHPNIIGIKEASGNLIHCMEIQQTTPDDFLLIAGDDALIVPIISIGGQGVISALGNVFPKIISQLVHAALSNHYEIARDLQGKLLPILQKISEGGNPVITKQLLALKALCSHHVRLPLCSPSRAMVKQLKELLNCLCSIE